MKNLILSGDQVFYTLQGEGVSIGRPVIFLRLHYCNLKCDWCDTKYTWDKSDERYFSEPERWSIREVIDELQKYDCQRVVITGGEPLIQADAIDELIKSLPDYKFEVETNGTIKPSKLMIERDVRFNVSPKLSNSLNDKKSRYKQDVLRLFNTIKSSFKFVVIGKKDLEEVEEIVDSCEIDKEKVILMPEGVTLEAQVEHGREIAEICKKKGFRLVPRLHIYLWGNERRV
jgi:7-carboxy-7-deazaguanine synthase